MKLLLLLSVLAFASATTAHFTLDSPPTRGFNEDTESEPFCGGFRNPSPSRAPFYYPHAPISITSHHDEATINVYLALGTADGLQSFLTLPPLVTDLKVKGMGEKCLYVKGDKVKGVEEGKNATIMVEYLSGTHGRLYQCSDVTLTKDEKTGGGQTCKGEVKEGSAAPAGNGTSEAPPSTNANDGVMMASAPAIGASMVFALMIAGFASLM